MAKYSKKLVSKCIYIQILKCTETDLLGQFMASGGWTLGHMWLNDGIASKNWPLVQELLELLLLCPVDVPRLQSNSAPKMVKSLSREGGNEGKSPKVITNGINFNEKVIVVAMFYFANFTLSMKIVMAPIREHPTQHSICFAKTRQYSQAHRPNKFQYIYISNISSWTNTS